MIAVQRRSRNGACISENAALAIASLGLQTRADASTTLNAVATLTMAIATASGPSFAQYRFDPAALRARRRFLDVMSNIGFSNAAAGQNFQELWHRQKPSARRTGEEQCLGVMP
jgi:hypothetical protein